MAILSDTVSSVIHLFYPELCAACQNPLGTGEQFLCLDCSISLPKTGFHKTEKNPVEQVFWGRFPIVSASAYMYFHKAAGAQNILHRIKYRGGKELAKTIGEWFGEDLASMPLYKSIDYIVPVPLHKSKERDRGYNQSEWFGQGLSKTMGIPMMGQNLVRIRKSETQTRKTREKRWQNVSGIFAVEQPEKFVNKHVLLVDDVVTTGATLEACAQTILALNCGSKISIATLAFAN